MAVEWSSSRSVDLHLELDATRGRRVAIEEALRDAIRAGRLAPGSALPSTRGLATDLAVARGTVTDAYDQLVVEGWLVARRGSGTAVAWTNDRGRARRSMRSVASPEQEPRYDFRPGAPDVSSFPRQEWVAAVRRSLQRAPDSALRYGDPRGLPMLREALAVYLARVRGVRADPDRIVVVAGFAQALALLTSVFAATGGRAVALEHPCIASYRETARRAGLAVVSLPVDDDGADPAPLPTGEGVAAAFLTPAHQYPTGTTLAPSRRSAFTTWARSASAFIVEDDYDGEFRYDRQPVGALQGMDPDCVVYVGTASKSLAPALRLGWMVVPGPLLDPIAATKELADRQTGAIEQLALAEIVTSGGLDRHVRRSRLRYRRRRDLLVSRLTSVGDLRLTGIAAGLHAVVELPVRGPGEAEVVERLAADGVAVHGLGRYWSRPGRRPGALVVGYGSPPEHAYRAGLDALTAALAGLYA